MAQVHLSSSSRPTNYDSLLVTGIVLTAAAATATVIALAIFLARSNSLAIPVTTPNPMTPGVTVTPFVPGIYGAKVATIVCGSATGALAATTLMYGLFRRSSYTLITD
jgi:hypothetical protein